MRLIIWLGITFFITKEIAQAEEMPVHVFVVIVASLCLCLLQDFAEALR